MKKWVFLTYLIMMLGGFVWIQYALSGGDDYSHEFEMAIESKVRAPKGAKWLIYNDLRYQLVNLGRARYVFQVLEVGDVVRVRVNERRMIVSLNYKDEVIYSVNDYEKNLEGLVGGMYETMGHITIVFVLIIVYLIRRSS